jgi:Tol biopolymer transport system component
VHLVLRPASDADGVSGTISPDGRTAAVLGGGAAGTTVHLINLDTGADRSTSVQVDSGPGNTTMVWTPDSHWLLAVDTIGHIVAVDPNGHSRVLTSGEMPITAIALRAE